MDASTLSAGLPLALACVSWGPRIVPWLLRMQFDNRKRQILGHRAVQRTPEMALAAEAACLSMLRCSIFCQIRANLRSHIQGLRSECFSSVESSSVPTDSVCRTVLVGLNTHAAIMSPLSYVHVLYGIPQ